MTTSQASRSQRFAALIILGFFLLVIWDGAARKWLLPGAERLLFILKDVFLLVCAASLVILRSRFSWPPMPLAALLTLSATAIWITFGVANPNLPNLLVGIWGWKAHLLYGFLLFMLPVAFDRSTEVLTAIERIYPWIVLPVCALAFLQLNTSAGSVWNQQLREEATAYFGEASLVRVSGPFSYLSGMASFVQASSLLGVGLYFGGSRRRSFLIGLLAVLATLPSTGSRAVVVVFLAGTAIILVGARVSGLMSRNEVIRAVLVVSILTALAAYLQADVWTALAQRAAGSREDEGRIFTAFTNAFDYMDLAGLTGFGTGAANLGAPGLTSLPAYSWLPHRTLFEEESGRVVIELGSIGWALGLLSRVALGVWALRLTVSGASPSSRRLALLALPVIGLSVYQGSGVFAPPLWNAHVWLMVGCLSVAEREHRRSAVNRAFSP